MEIPRAEIQQLLRDHGDHERARAADQQLARPVEGEHQRDLLARIGINLNELSSDRDRKVGP